MTKYVREQEGEQLTELFKQHLKEHHHIDTDKDFLPEEVKDHLEAKKTLLPVSIFLSGGNAGLSPLETIVKYLRETEELTNAQIARFLGRTGANTWLTYRNANQKMKQRLEIKETDIFTPDLSILETICSYLHEKGFTYAKIAKMLVRNERTIWTVVNRAMKKIAAKGSGVKIAK